VFDSEARGWWLAGLTLRHSRAHLFRAAYEGIAFGIRRILDLFDESATPVTRTVAVGGGVNSPWWISIVSDVTGRTQLIPRGRGRLLRRCAAGRDRYRPRRAED
jgi:xylulokinase